MVPPQPLTGTGDSYRLEKGSAFLVWATLAVLALVGLGLPPLAMALLPLALVFTRLNPYRFLVIWIASTLFFFETYRSTFLFVSVSDALPFVYAFLLLAFSLPRGLAFRVPVNAAFAPLYLLVLLALGLAPRAFAAYEPLSVLFDLKMIFLLAFIPVLIALEGSKREPKKIFLLLGTVILFSCLHSIEVVASFMVSGGKRPVTWGGIFMVNAVLFCAVLLRLPFSRATLWKLRLALAINTIGVIFTMTRGLWLSLVLCLGLLLLLSLWRMRGRALGFVLRIALVAIVGFLATNLAFSAAMDKSLVEFVSDRFSALQWIDLLDPYSSTGYRVHEAWAVWDERTFWGHGPGAVIHLFFTQMDKSEFMDWWSIHSGYFELLHKYGFAGLMLVGWMAAALCVSAWRLGRRKNRWESAAGTAALLMLLNHIFFSISSNELNRPNSPIMWFLAFYITVKLGSRGRPDTASRGKPSAA